jgi:xanthosine utilization system XapX-like protein
LWFLKLYASALSPLLALIGLLSIIVGLATGSAFISLIGMYDVLIFCIHIFRVTRSPDFSSSLPISTITKQNL